MILKFYQRKTITKFWMVLAFFIVLLKLNIFQKMYTSYLIVDLADFQTNIKINFDKNPASNYENIKMHEKFSLNIYNYNNKEFIEVNEDNYQHIPHWNFISPLECAEQIIDFSNDNP